MENNHTNQCTGTDFAELWDNLKEHNLVACSEQKTSLGASPQPYIQDKNIVKMAMPPALKQKINQSPPIGDRSDELWGAIHLLLKADYSVDEIITTILDHPIGEKAHEKPDPYNWLKPQVLKARYETTSPKTFDNYQILDDTLARAQNKEPEAIFDQPFIDTMCELKRSNVVDFEKYRQKAKNIQGVSIGRVDKLVQANEKKEKKSSAQTFFEVLEPNIELFRDQTGKPHIAFLKDRGTKLVMPLNSPEASKQISYEINRISNDVIDSHVLKSLIMLMEGYAANNGDVRDVFIRHGFYDGTYYIDIGNDSQDGIKIDQKGVQIIRVGTLLFRRTQTMKPLPYPDSKGDVTLLWKYIRLSKSEQLMLLVWIMECFRPDTQYPILELNGEKGSGKSEGSRFIRAFIDPNSNEILTSPRDEQDVVAAAANNAVLCYDNLAKMNVTFQNLLCSVATGGSISTRRYFTNFDEASAKIMKPVIFNSINGLISQSDLADRAIRITFQKIENYTPVSELRENFMKDYPSIFSGMLDLFSRALQRIPQIKPDGKARMGDFQILGEAVSQEMGNAAGYFSQILRQNKMDYSYENLRNSAVGSAVVSYFEEEEAEPFEKTSINNVKNSLEGYSDYNDEWPETEKKMASDLRKLSPLFEEIGIKIHFHTRKGRGVPITIKKITNENSND
jgi:hypothetical protein